MEKVTKKNLPGLREELHFEAVHKKPEMCFLELTFPPLVQST